MGSLLLSMRNGLDAAPPETPAWVKFPGDRWETMTPEEAGLDVKKFRAWVENQRPEFGKEIGGQRPGGGGVVITRGGYIVQEWGDPEFKHQSASLGKTFTRMALQLAIDDGLIKSAGDPVHEYWSGRGYLASHKVLDGGHHRALTFSHLVEIKGGFPVTNGFFWKKKEGKKLFYPGTPTWADWTGDPDYDNYAHVEPGQHEYYSSGGYWRLSQILTAIWKQDLKQVLDHRIMSKIGIPPDRWDWLTGRQVREDFDFYPDLPGYGEYLDAPYEIDGVNIRGGPGWVIMSASDLARVGLLIATGGEWKGKRLISEIGGNSAVNSYGMKGWGKVRENGPFSLAKNGYFSFGKVATDFREPEPELLASWVIGQVNKVRAMTEAVN